MSETITLARPYARAVFRLAREQDRLADWSQTLALLGAIVADPLMQAIIDSPRLSRAEVAQLVIDVAGEGLDEYGRNLVRLLAEKGRLSILPDIAALYERLRAEAEGSIEAEVVTAQPLDETQLATLAERLQARLGKAVQLHQRVDESLLGGAIIRAGDLVIDGSLKTRLEKLASALTR